MILNLKSCNKTIKKQIMNHEIIKFYGRSELNFSSNCCPIVHLIIHILDLWKKGSWKQNPLNSQFFSLTKKYCTTCTNRHHIHLQNVICGIPLIILNFIYEYCDLNLHIWGRYMDEITWKKEYSSRNIEMF
jgi:hypothetical protein